MVGWRFMLVIHPENHLLLKRIPPPKTPMKPESRPSWKESHLPNLDFLGASPAVKKICSGLVTSKQPIRSNILDHVDSSCSLPVIYLLRFRCLDAMFFWGPVIPPPVWCLEAFRVLVTFHSGCRDGQQAGKLHSTPMQAKSWRNQGKNEDQSVW